MLFSSWVGQRDQIPGDGVTIGDDVWIGASATVLGGIAIGTGAIVGAGSVVTGTFQSPLIVVATLRELLAQRLRQHCATTRRSAHFKESLSHAH